MLLAAGGLALAEDRLFPVDDNAASRQLLKRSVAYLASISVEEMLALVPIQSGIFYTDCPNCELGTQDRGHFRWTPERPGHIECEDCGAVYPGHTKYAADQMVKVAGPGGIHHYPYYQRPQDDYRIYFRAHADYRAREYMAEKCRDFARLYVLTGRADYAQRAAAILIRFAEVYPGYAYHYDYPFRQKIIQPYTQNRVRGVAPYRTAKWSWWAYLDISLELVEAYQHLKSWPRLTELRQGRAVQMVEQDLLGAMAQFVIGFGETYTNMSPVMWRRLLLTGRVLERPEWVHEVVRRYEQFLETRFLYDGHWMETAPSYGAQTLGGMRSVLDAAHGYSDPPGYTDANDGRHFEQLDLAKDTQRYQLAERSVLAPRLPNGRLIPVNDTWSTARRAARQKTEPVLLPAMGVAVLGGGHGDDQYHAHLNFTSGRQHKHRDALSLGLFAFGKELFPDIGYTHTKYRCWATSTMSHNTVVVNGLESRLDADWSGHRLGAFVTDRRGFHLVDAQSVSAYGEITDRYRRVVVAVGTGTANCYLVDIFQVIGGSQHDYLLHGSADEDCIAQLLTAGSSTRVRDPHGSATASSLLKELPLSPYPSSLLNRDAVFVPPTGESSDVGRDGGYGFVSSLKSATIFQPVALDVRIENESGTGTGTRTWLLPEPQTQVFLGRAPSIRRARESDDSLDEFQAPFFCARRQAKQLESLFVAVHEVYRGAPALSVPPQVTRVDGDVCLVIEPSAGRRDYVLVAAAQGAGNWSQETTAGVLSGSARYALVRCAEGVVVEAHLVGGSSIKLGDFSLSGGTAWRGKLSATRRTPSGQAGGYLEVAERIRGSAAGRTLMVTQADGSVQAYEVLRLEPISGGGTRLHVREDPGFEITGDGRTIMKCYPQRTIEGPPRAYEMLNEVHWYGNQ